MVSRNYTRTAFTLIELLVVIAIIAILAVVVVLTLNPAQLLAQSRDANRVSDMATLNSAINLYNTDQSGASSYSLGAASTSYISIPSSVSNCSSLGLATSAFSYSCSTSGNYRIASSSGWLPINFQAISAGAPFGSLPVDPVNQTSSNLYYSYETNGSQYVLSSFMESSKYAKNMATTGGIDLALYEIGSGAATLPNASRGLVGYWPLNEGVGSSTIDWSGYGNNGTWSGTAAGTNGYYSSGKAWGWGAYFNGVNDYIDGGVSNNLNITTNDFTVAVWINGASWANAPIIVGKENTLSVNPGWLVGLTASGTLDAYINDGTADPLNVSGAALNTGQWYFAAFVFQRAGNLSVYTNGVLTGTMSISGHQNSLANSYNSHIGAYYSGSPQSFFNGSISDLRIYDRALSASEIQQIYNAER